MDTWVKHPIHREQERLDYALQASNVLRGFVLDQGHAVLLCEQGRTWTYATKRMKQRAREESTS